MAPHILITALAAEVVHFSNQRFANAPSCARTSGQSHPSKISVGHDLPNDEFCLERLAT
jgi:hypothetical protein